MIVIKNGVYHHDMLHLLTNQITTYEKRNLPYFLGFVPFPPFLHPISNIPFLYTFYLNIFHVTPTPI